MHLFICDRCSCVDSILFRKNKEDDDCYLCALCRPGKKEWHGFIKRVIMSEELIEEWGGKKIFVHLGKFGKGNILTERVRKKRIQEKSKS